MRSAIARVPKRGEAGVAREGSRKWLMPPTSACASQMQTATQEPRMVVTCASSADANRRPGAR